MSCGVFVATFRNSNAETSITATGASLAPTSAIVPVVTVQKPVVSSDQAKVINIRGKVVSDGNVKIAASVPATIQEILFTQGQQVKKGDVLMRLGGSDGVKHSLELAYEQAQLNQANLRTTLKNAQSAVNVAVRQAEQQVKALDVSGTQLQRTLALTQNAGHYTVEGAQIGIENLQNSLDRTQILRERNASQIDLTGDQAKEIAALQAQNVARSLLTTLKGGYLPLVSGIKDITDNRDFRNHESDVQDVIDHLDQQRDVDSRNVTDDLSRLSETLYDLLDVNENIATDVNEITSAQAKPLADALKLSSNSLTNAITVAITQVATTKNQLEALPGSTGIQLRTLDSQVASLSDQLRSLQLTIDQATNASELQAQGINTQLQNIQQQKISANLALESAKIAAKSQTDNLSGQINLVDKQVEQAKNALQQLEITSAIDGYITDVPVNEGEDVSVGRELVTIYATNVLFVRSTVVPADREAIRVGDLAQLTVSSTINGEKIVAHIVRIAPVADSTGQIPVDLEFDQAELPGGYVPGVTIQGQITISDLVASEQLSSEIKVPLDAIVLEEGKSFVFVYVNGVAHRKEIVLGPSSNDVVFIVGGITSNDVIILTPAHLSDGVAVTVSNE